ncbi:alpha/beta fold hydrolase [Streptomyces sp. NPDC059477]|uniref:alpha/beta fold hydrolase n=1 Tax=Streptomyces sp. NPDC059477 TaxID=3346847 RepID=UPI0036ABEA5E
MPTTTVHEYSPVPDRIVALQAAGAKRAALIDGPGEYAHVKPRTPDNDGDTEIVGTTTVTHRFVDAPGDSETVRWHYVEAGSGPVVVFLHGIPESWFMWHRQIDALAATHRVIAIDLKGYGQSEKGTGDYRQVGVAEQLSAMLTQIGVDRFQLVAHDRGSVVGDYFAAAEPERIVSYLRASQHLYHLNPIVHPQERLFTDPSWVHTLAKPAQLIRTLYTLGARDTAAESDIVRTIQEFSYEDVARAVPRYFNSSSFRKEWIDRRERLMHAWDFPVLLLQGYDDPFQPREFYEDAHNWVPNSTVEFIDAGHFFHFENPADTTAAIVRFVTDNS